MVLLLLRLLPVVYAGRSEDRLSEQEQQLKEREAELAEALAALEVSRKALEGAAAFVQVLTTVHVRSVGRSVCRLRFEDIISLRIFPAFNNKLYFLFSPAQNQDSRQATGDVIDDVPASCHFDDTSPR